jgi:hypothetical protein
MCFDTPTSRATSAAIRPAFKRFMAASVHNHKCRQLVQPRFLVGHAKTVQE